MTLSAHRAHRPAALAAAVAVGVACLSWTAVLARAPTPVGYAWSANVAVAPAEPGRQRAETALASDGERLWLSYLDAEYKRLPDGKWVAWPRKVALMASDDQGATWADLGPLSEMGGDEALAVGGKGVLWASWIAYDYDAAHKLKQKVAVAKIQRDGKRTPLLDCLPWDQGTIHDQSSLAPAADGGMHVVGTDIHPRHKGRPELLYARVAADQVACIDPRRLPSVGPLPQLAETASGLVMVGPEGYVASHDGGKTFSAAMPRPFGDKLARIAISPDRKTVYVVGDSAWNGIKVHASDDGGRTWRRADVVASGPAKGWRFPVLHVDRAGRVHVAWLDDGSGSGVVYHSHSGDRGATFSAATKVSDRPFPFPAKAPPPPPGTQDGSWIGDYIALTSVGDAVLVAWSDQRAGPALSTVYVAIGRLPR